MTLFPKIGPHLLQPAYEYSINEKLATCICSELGDYQSNAIVESEIFITVRIQLLALNYIGIKYVENGIGGFEILWDLTPLGAQAMFRTRTVKAKNSAT